MVDFITEVQDELRKDDYNTWLRRFGPYLIGLVVAVLVIAGYLEWRKATDGAEARATSVQYTNAGRLAADGDVDGAVQAFASLADTAPDGYAGLALMRAAALETDRGNRSEAVRYLDAASGRFPLPRHADLASLKAAYALVADGRFADARARLAPIMAEGAPYEFLARELNAHAALASGDAEAARRDFTYLATIPGVTEGVQRRAEQSLGLLRAGDAPATPTDSTSALEGNEG